MWFDPEELLAQQAREIAAVEAGNFSGKGHFGSYYALLKGKDGNWACSHSTVSDRLAFSYARELACSLGHRLDGIRSILDVGSGVGAITNSLKRIVSHAAVTGIDIAEAGVTYAREKYPDCSFICTGFGGDTDLGSRFDLVHCKGFLPFVRTSDLSVHVKYLAACARHLFQGRAARARPSRPWRLGAPAYQSGPPALCGAGALEIRGTHPVGLPIP